MQLARIGEDIPPPPDRSVGSKRTENALIDGRQSSSEARGVSDLGATEEDDSSVQPTQSLVIRHNQ